MPDETPSTVPVPTQSASGALQIPKKKVVLNEHGATAKIRNPWLVALFTLITIGIYYLFWYYFVNREMADYGEANKIDIGHSPGMSVVAITIGAVLLVGLTIGVPAVALVAYAESVSAPGWASWLVAANALGHRYHRCLGRAVGSCPRCKEPVGHRNQPAHVWKQFE